MARTSRGKLEHINKQALVGITGVISQHPFVNVLLSTFALQKGKNVKGTRNLNKLFGFHKLQQSLQVLLNIKKGSLKGSRYSQDSKISLKIDEY